MIKLRNLPIITILNLVLCFIASVSTTLGNEEPKFVTHKPTPGQFCISDSLGCTSLVVSVSDFEAVKIATQNLVTDIFNVSGFSPSINNDKLPATRQIILIGTLGKNQWIDKLVKEKKINVGAIAGKWESFQIQTVTNPFAGIDKALVIAGSDKRGTVYGIYEISEQLGVSPWFWWADVPVVKNTQNFVVDGCYTYGSPKVKYRGIFLNDEAPALTGWANEKFGGFNHKFYAKVFELILRLRGNYIWPAMWGKAFFDDDPENGKLANDMGVVIGTSHHEPLGRAHDEWRRYGKGPWDYSKNDTVLRAFWKAGMERMKNFETITTIGMRGDGDMAMSEGTNIALLEKIVTDQRKIINDVTNKKPEAIPQLWALYKEVQDYYDKGMRVPKDVTLLLCDDNWGDVRKLPDVSAPAHPGGYGMYYHVDYVGGPRNYKWLNVSQIQRIWEQMNLTWSHGVDRIWILNVGDLKPMEYPISFFLDMAWDPTRFNAQNLLQHTENWCAQQFGPVYAKEAARIINLYTKYNHRVTPELLNSETYSLENYNEFERVRNEYRNLALDAYRLYFQLPVEYRDAFDQLVLFPTNACSNLYDLYFAVAKNKQLAKTGNPEANFWANVAKDCFVRDSMLTIHYNREISGGKWLHMMDQVHIGYTYWQQPDKNKMPGVTYVENNVNWCANRLFAEADGYVSIEAGNYQKAQGTSLIHWEVIPCLGKTESGISTFPQNKYPLATDTVYLEYAVKFSSSGIFDVSVLVSPTLNFNANKGLRYAVSFDGGPEQIVNINQKYTPYEMEQWQAKRINKTVTKHTIAAPGIHRLRFRVLEPGIVLQKILIDTGGLKPSYLGAPQSNLINIE